MSLSLPAAVPSAAAEAGARVFLVGGGLRGQLLGRDPSDIDLLVEGDPAGFLSALAARAGRAPVLFSRRAPETWRLDLEGLFVDVSAFGEGDLDEALMRRDFTINALAAPVRPDGRLGDIHDPAGGLDDLRAGWIRGIRAVNLDEDPLRLLRAVRLAVCLEGFRMTDSLMSDIRARASRLPSAAPERIRAEMDTILRSSRAGSGLRSMLRLGLLFPVLPELSPLEGLGQNEWHEHDALEHTLRAVEAADDLQADAALDPSGSEVLKWAALLHDIGKARTRTVGKDGRVHFYGHETVSAAEAASALGRLRAPGRVAARVTRLVAHHLRLILLDSAPKVTDRALRRYVRALAEDTPLGCLLALADRRAAGGPDAADRVARLEELARRVLAVWEEQGEEIVHMKPLLDGDEVMRLLAIGPGPRVGAVQRWLLGLQLDGEVSSREEAMELLRSLPPARLPSGDTD